MDYSASSNYTMHILQVAISIIFESVFFLQYVVLLTIEVVDCSIMASNINLMPVLPNMNDQKLLTPNGYSVDSLVQTEAVIMSLSLLSVQAANLLVMDNSKQITFQLPDLQDQR
jgi:hypothetical protein